MNFNVDKDEAELFPFLLDSKDSPKDLQDFIKQQNQIQTKMKTKKESKK